MGLMDDVSRAVYSAVPRKLELDKNITIAELNDVLEQHTGEFDVPFKMSTFLVKRITFKRHPRLEMQLILTVKDNVIKITPNLQEGEVGNGTFSVKTTTFKNGFGLATELNRDDYITLFVEKLQAMLRQAGYNSQLID